MTYELTMAATRSGMKESIFLKDSSMLDVYQDQARNTLILLIERNINFYLDILYMSVKRCVSHKLMMWVYAVCVALATNNF